MVHDDTVCCCSQRLRGYSQCIYVVLLSSNVVRSRVFTCQQLRCPRVEFSKHRRLALQFLLEGVKLALDELKLHIHTKHAEE